MPATNLRETVGGTTISNVVNGDLGNNITSYTYFNLARDGWRYFTLIYTLQNTTITIEATNDGVAVADADADWLDVTDLLSSSSSLTTSGSIAQDTPIVFGRLRIKQVTTNATNACKLDLALAN